jgi:uncharacterized protein (DUF488 family)
VASAATERHVPIYTIGYGSRTMDEFVAVLQANEVAFLIDIRSMPYSRFKPEFSKDALEIALRAHGIRYLYMGDSLGGQPADRDCYVDDKVDYTRLAAKPFYRAGISRVRQAFEKQLHVTLMCSEGQPETCHRSKLIGQTLVDEGIAVRHIDENGELLTQEDVLLRYDDGQMSLFPAETTHFTSRKRYRARDALGGVPGREGDDGEDAESADGS